MAPGKVLAQAWGQNHLDTELVGGDVSEIVVLSSDFFIKGRANTV